MVGVLLALSAAHSALAQQADPPPPSAVPLSEAEEADLRNQIESNWNAVSRSEACADRKVGIIELRVFLAPDGAASKVEPLNLPPGDGCALVEFEKAKRAVMISGQLKLPPDKNFKTLRLRFYPDAVMQ